MVISPVVIFLLVLVGFLLFLFCFVFTVLGRKLRCQMSSSVLDSGGVRCLALVHRARRMQTGDWALV